ncbi:MAG: YicC family protein [Lachnospiraceae bacterium]|nr:YicC family protein [Lachnospiraceae bacterium]
MIKSMTGFGRSEKTNESRRIVIEMKAVNHRYADVSFKMPKKLGPFEIQMRNILKEYAKRGKIDIYMTYEEFGEQESVVSYNENIAKEYLKYMKQMAENLELVNDVKVTHMSRFPEVFTLRELEIDEEALWGFIEPVFRDACDKFVEARSTEGKRLYDDLISKLDHMLELVEEIDKRYPDILKEYRSKLTEKVKELLSTASVDESRIATEVTIFADKICVDEETVRLKSHVSAARDTLASAFLDDKESEGIGRKLDFIAQEMNREANTILSKSTDIEISNIGIDLKTEIEKVREQIQNIE